MSSNSKLISDDDFIRFNENEVIFCEGEPSTYLYIIKSGRVRVVKEAGDRLIPLTILSEKEFLGEMAIFNDGPRSASAITTEFTELVKVNKDEIVEQLGLCADWVRKIMLTISDRLRSANEIIREHKIIDDRLCADNALSPQQEKELVKIFAEYREKNKN